MENGTRRAEYADAAAGQQIGRPLRAEPVVGKDPITMKPATHFKIMDGATEIARIPGRLAKSPEEAVAAFEKRQAEEKRALQATRASLSGGGVGPQATEGGFSTRAAGQGDVRQAAQALEAWFGNSQVTDPDGQPLVVFHGSDAVFDTFSAGEFGFHFGDENAATIMGKARPFLLSIQNPLSVPDIGVWSPDRVLQEVQKRMRLPATEVASAQAEVARLEREMQVDLDQDRDMFANRRAHYAWSKPVRELLKRHGYDGFVYQNEAEGFGMAWVAFDPEQIRPAPEAILALRNALPASEDESEDLEADEEISVFRP